MKVVVVLAARLGRICRRAGTRSEAGGRLTAAGRRSEECRARRAAFSGVGVARHHSRRSAIPQADKLKLCQVVTAEAAA